MSLDVGQWAALGADLGAAPARLGAAAAPVANASLDAVEQDAKARAAVLTGEMRGRVQREMDGDGLGGRVYDDSDHAFFNEYGTSKMAAQPFVGPALDAGVPVLEEGLAAAGEAAVL